MSARDVLALFAKAPVPGQVKTRLCPPLAPAQAARLYEAMLLDIVGQHLGDPPSVERVLWFAPEGAEGWFREHVPPGYALLAQRGATLAERMRALFHHHCDRGATRVVLRGTDSPTLPGVRVREAFAALDRADLVLCPDRDGGYNLIGLRKPADELFDLEMSTGSVLDTTRARARELGLQVALLEPHHDVDTEADLRLLRAEVDAKLTPRTAQWLAQHPAHGAGGTA